MSTATLKPKCYIVVCAGCDLLFQAERPDQLTCSGACRVRAHRNGFLKSVRELAATLEIPPAIIMQTSAIERLRPDLYARLGEDFSIDEAQPEVCNAFMKVLQQALEATE